MFQLFSRMSGPLHILPELVHYPILRTTSHIIFSEHQSPSVQLHLWLYHQESKQISLEKVNSISLRESAVHRINIMRFFHSPASVFSSDALLLYLRVHYFPITRYCTWLRPFFCYTLLPSPSIIGMESRRFLSNEGFLSLFLAFFFEIFG